MYTLMDAHLVSIIIVVSSMLVTPLYIFATYVYSGASQRKGMAIASGFLVWGGFMTWVCLAQIPVKIGPLGGLVIPICWITPSLILFWKQDWFLSHPLSQHWLVGLQVWRVIGGVFLIEMTRSNIPGIFAYPAGIGDMLVGLTAIYVLVKYRNHDRIPNKAIILVLVLGVVDFISAFFFGSTSQEGPMQLFVTEIPNNTMQFPTGMIPYFLVPYAIFFHTLSWLALRNENS